MKFFLGIYTCCSLFQYFVTPYTSLAFSTVSTIITWTTVLSIVPSATGTEDEDESHESQFPLRRHTPYYNAELYKVLRQHNKFQDFLWAGSGEGPVPSENQDGLAWEDDVLTPGKEQIKVTKTMVLYTTVLSTIYPVAMTPVIVTSNVSPTILVTIEPSLTIATDIMTVSITPTATLSPDFVVPTVTSPPLPDSQTEHPGGEDSSESLNNDRLSAAATDPRFWIQTSIKKKRDGYHPNDLVFQELMQKRLADIYATAFKRQLLKSLRLMGQQEMKKRINETIKFKTKRDRRSMDSFGNLEYNNDDAETNPLYFFLRDQSATARTAMNVSVSMINVTWTEREPKVELRYIVYAEGSPIQGFVAVKELQVVSKKEMEDKLGYEIITKAEALVQPLERSEIGSVASTTPWLIGLMILVCLMILILMLTLFMAWSWRHNRLTDRQSDRLTTVPEGGLVHPASPPSGHSMLVSRQESYSGEDRKSTAGNSPSPSVFRIGQGREVETGAGIGILRPMHPSRRGELDIEASEPAYERSSPEDKSSSSMLINPTEGSSYHSHSPQRRNKSKSSSVARKVNKKRRNKRLPHTEDLKSPLKSPAKDPVKNSQDERDFSFTGDICRNMDKIVFGNLDIYADSESRASSAQAKKILSRPSSHEQKKSQPQSLDVRLLETEVQTHERDREFSEESFEVSESSQPQKDAEVQTPTRLKSKHIPRVRTSPRHRSSKGKASKMSLVSTESEEVVEFRNLPSSSEDVNPIGRIRKRFHQFLDDAFNVMATGRKESPGKCPQSAKVTVTHQMKSTTPTRRPWTSHVIREESLRKVRPKSSVGFGPPKRAWTAGSERRCQSAKSKASIVEEEILEDFKEEEVGGFTNPGLLEQETREGHGFSSRSSSTLRTDCQQSLSEASQSYAFPKYPTYPEMDVCMDPHWTGPGTSQAPARRLHPLDPAVPLIEAIKDEMKRFEKVKVSTNEVGSVKKS